MLTLSSTAPYFDKGQLFWGSENFKLISKLEYSNQKKKIPRKVAPK